MIELKVCQWKFVRIKPLWHISCIWNCCHWNNEKIVCIWECVLMIDPMEGSNEAITMGRSLDFCAWGGYRELRVARQRRENRGAEGVGAGGVSPSPLLKIYLVLIWKWYILVDSFGLKSKLFFANDQYCWCRYRNSLPSAHRPCSVDSCLFLAAYTCFCLNTSISSSSWTAD